MISAELFIEKGITFIKGQIRKVYLVPNPKRKDTKLSQGKKT